MIQFLYPVIDTIVALPSPRLGQLNPYPTDDQWPVCREEKVDDMILELSVAAQVLTDQWTDARSSVRESHHPAAILSYISGKQLNKIISVSKKIIYI